MRRPAGSRRSIPTPAGCSMDRQRAPHPWPSCLIDA